jgi:flagellar FliJ protein
MSPFRFRLQRILDLRAEAERVQAQVLSEAARAEERERATLDAAAVHLSRCGSQIADAARGASSAGMLSILNLAVQAAATGMAAARDSHTAATVRLAVEEERFGTARQERRIVERLRDRRLAAWSEQASREEQRDLDALARRRTPPGAERVEP